MTGSKTRSPKTSSESVASVVLAVGRPVSVVEPDPPLTVLKTKGTGVVCAAAAAADPAMNAAETNKVLKRFCIMRFKVT